MGDAAYSHEAMPRSRPSSVSFAGPDGRADLKNPLIGFKIMQAMNQKLTNLRSLVQSLRPMRVCRAWPTCCCSSMKKWQPETIRFEFIPRGHRQFHRPDPRTVSRKLAQCR
jgi:hypothetical protein